MSRLVVVSNRVAPITEGQATAGGLAAGVLDALKQQGGIWFGWSGDTVLTPSGHAKARQKVGPISLYTIDLSRKDYDEFYRGFANDTLWPVLHYQMGLSKFAWEEFSGYQRVNDQFARALMPILEPDDLVWAHDYHLLCLADSLRQAGCRNRIGLFLHTPFPAPPVFMTVPAHAELIQAMCQYDLIGFQTETDRAGFADYVLRHCEGELAETTADGQTLRAYGRAIRTGVYPIGVHVDEVRSQAKAQANKRTADRLRGSLRHRQLILSVDRLDYSKGLRQRFQAFERFLEDCPAARSGVSFLQIAPPSRGDIQTYKDIRRELEAEAGRINGRFAEIDWTPLRYLNKSFPRSALMPLYDMADVGLVTPLRDGMNLVAKEYIAAQNPEDPGVLILSQFAGAACELDAALLINPYDSVGVAMAMDRALSMRLEERQERHAAMMEVMRRNSLDRWRDRFTGDLAQARPQARETIAGGVAQPASLALS